MQCSAKERKKKIMTPREWYKATRKIVAEVRLIFVEQTDQS